MARVQPRDVMVQRGDVWTVATVANEQPGTRRCLVVSADRFNALPIRQAIVAPLTTRERGFPHHVRVADDGGLDRPSWAMCEGLRTVSTHGFGRRVSRAQAATVTEVLAQLDLWLKA